jgi:hypothetical protein
MRWIDINLPEPGNCHQLDAALAAAASLTADIEEIQQRYGLDAVRVIDLMKEAGQHMFQAVVAVDKGAFSPAEDPDQPRLPLLDQPEHDALTGYHVVAGPEHISLPWTWLHNGLEFLFEKHPICASVVGSQLPADSEHRPWMQRLTRSRFLVGEDGSSSLMATLAQLRPTDSLPPELLFVPGHSDRQTRRMIYREAEIITGSLEDGFMGNTLAKVTLPLVPMTPDDLKKQGLGYQAIHFAGPTGQPARQDDNLGEYWMNRLIEETAALRESEVEDMVGIEGEVLGIDPITSLLDDAVQNYAENGPPPTSVSVGRDRAGRTAAAGSGDSGPAAASASSQRTWLLEDGPVGPEGLGQSGSLPPLVFSNSYRALPELGHRFTREGASTFVGPMVPLYSRPARIFAGYFYLALGEGWCAGAAVWRAALACRKELGAEHPAWLSYGIQGYGSLALQYL